MMKFNATVVRSLLLFFATTACGGPSEDTKQQDALSSLAALDGVPSTPDGVDQIPGQVFPFHMKSFAAELESAAIAARRPIDDPEVAGSIRDLFRRVLLESEGIRDDGFVESCLSVELLTVGQAASRNELEFFSVGGMASVLKPCVLHPASPAGSWSQIPLLAAPSGSGEPHAVYVTTPPTHQLMKSAAKTGTCLWLIGPGTPAEEGREKPTIRPIADRGQALLAASVLYTNPTNRRAFYDASLRPGTRLSCHIKPLPKVESKMVIGRIKGVGSRGRLVVKVQGKRGSFGSEPASRGMQLAVVLDVMRVLVINLSRRESWRPPCDIDFVHVMDRGSGGFDWGGGKGGRRPILGVIEVGGVAAQDAASESIVLTFDPGDGASACERSVVVAASQFLGKPGAWKGAFLRTSSKSRISRESAHAVGQQRVPTVTLAGCVRNDTASKTPPSIWATESAPGSDPFSGIAPSLHWLAGTSGDRVAQIGAGDLRQSVNVGRLLLLTVLKAAHATQL